MSLNKQSPTPYFYNLPDKFYFVKKEEEAFVLHYPNNHESQNLRYNFMIHQSQNFHASRAHRLT